MKKKRATLESKLLPLFSTDRHVIAPEHPSLAGTEGSPNDPYAQKKRSGGYSIVPGPPEYREALRGANLTAALTSPVRSTELDRALGSGGGEGILRHRPAPTQELV